MKFLIPNYCVPDSFVDNVAYTLREMGHEVITLKSIENRVFNSPYRRLIKTAVNSMLRNELSVQEKWLLQNFKEIKPDVVLTLTQSLSAETLRLLKSHRIKTVAWWGDTAANMKGNGLLDESWDLIFIKDAYAAFKLQSLGLPAMQLLEAMNPAWHKPISTQNNNKLVVAGSFYDYRHYLVKKLLHDKIALDLYGGRLPAWADNSIKSLHSGRYIIREEKSSVFGASLGVLNSTAMSEFDSVNCRAFEIAGTGGLQIMEYRPSIEHCFVPGKEILVYKTYEELTEIYHRAIAYPQEMEKVREAGLKRALNEHTYLHRLDVIIKKLQEIK